MAAACAEAPPVRRRGLLAGALAAGLTACAPRRPPPPEAMADAPVTASAEVRAVAARIGRGINFGNMLDAPREGDWDLRVEDRYIDLVGTPGFTQSVRLPVRWSNHAAPDAAARIEPAFLARVESIVDRLLGRGAVVVLNMHHYRQLDGDPLDPGEFAVDPAVVQPRLMALWQQIAERFASRPPALVFEIYNEPHGALEPQWNALFARALAVVRRSNPTRAVVVGPTHWNAASHLDRLVLPPDPHLLLTVHHYEPFDFTHQGAEWVQPPRPTGLDCCDDVQRQAIEGPLAQAAAYARRRGLPIFVGEFGAYGKAPPDARLRYLRLMREALERHGLPWFYWELAAGFGVYDPHAGRFREPLRQVLFGP